MTAAEPATTVQKFRFSPTDRISVGAVNFICVQSNADGHMMKRVDSLDHREFFTHDQIDAFRRSGALTHDPSYFSASTQIVLSQAEASHLGLLSDNEQMEILRRTEYVRRFLEHERATFAKRKKRRAEGFDDQRVTRSDASMKRIIGLINAEMRAMDYETALARINNGRRRFGVKCVIAKPISARTLRRWLTAYERAECNVLALRPRYRFCGDRTPFYDFDAYRFIRKHAVAYATRERPGIAACHRAMEKELASFNEERRSRGAPDISLPSKTLLREHIASLDAFQVYAQREGVEKARKKFGPTGQGPDASRLLQRVEMDAWEVHLKVLLIETGAYELLSPEMKEKVERVRLWLTVIIDCASRYILAMKLTPTDDAEAAVQTLAMALSDKTSIAQAAGAVAPWSRTGTPEGLFVDNGYSSKSFRTAAIAALPHASVTPAALPWLRPYIERLFRTFDLQLMPLFSGRTFANIIEAEGYDDKRLASLTVEELATVLVRYVVDIYHLSPHEGLGGKAPIDAWEDLEKEAAPAPPPDKNKFTAIFGVSGKRSLSKEGLTFLGVTYQSEELQAWRRRHGDQDIEIKVHPDDVSFATAFFDNAWRRVTPITDGLQGISVTDHLAAAEFAAKKNAGKAAAHRTTVLEAYRELGEIGANARRRIGIGERAHTPQELQQAEEIFRSGLHVSTATENEPPKKAAAPSPRLAQPDLFDAGFIVGGPPKPPKEAKAAPSPRPAGKQAEFSFERDEFGDDE